MHIAGAPAELLVHMCILEFYQPILYDRILVEEIFQDYGDSSP